MLRKKITAIVAVMIIFLLGACSSQPKSALQSPADAFRAEGIAFTQIQLTGNALELQGVNPLDYKLDNGEIVSVYAFDSAAKREAGYQDFLKHQQIQSSHAPIVFEAGSFLVTYRNNVNSSTQTAKLSDTQYGEKIRQAVLRVK